MENKEAKKPEQPEVKKEKSLCEKFQEMPYDFSRAGQTLVFTTPMRAKKEEEEIQYEEADENAPSDYIKNLVMNWRKQGYSNEAIADMLHMAASFGIINDENWDKYLE